MEQAPGNASTLIAASEAAVAPKLLRGALAVSMAEFAALLLRGTAVVILLSPALLAAALLL